LATRPASGRLRYGLRGLPGGSSLAIVLADRRGYRNGAALPRLTVRQILRWADAYHAEFGRWPQIESGPIPATADTWEVVDVALRQGTRGLKGGTSLPRLLAQRRGARSSTAPPPLTIRQVVAWAREHRRRTGKWPRRDSGPVEGVPRENWRAIDEALWTGRRGLPSRWTLPRLLERHCGARNRGNLPRLSEEIIVRWEAAHHARTGKWPNISSGPVAEAPGETWLGVDAALVQRHRGLPGGSSLAQVRRKRRTS
jgi:hypothetical protein